MSAATEFAPVVAVPASQQFPGECSSSFPRRLHAVAADDRAVAPGPPLTPVAPAGQGHRRGITVLYAPSRVAPSVSPLRLTRRGVVVMAALVSLAAGALVWLAAASAPDASPAGATGTGGASVVIVEAGDTLWSIASRLAPERDPRAEVDSLRRANHLTGTDLVPGQRLRLP